MACPASLDELISTKPKPRERPVSRSVTTVADSHVPTTENSASRSALVVLKDRFPTKSFLPMAFSCPFGAVVILSRLPERESRDRPREAMERSRANKRTRPLCPDSAGRAIHGLDRSLSSTLGRERDARWLLYSLGRVEHLEREKVPVGVIVEDDPGLRLIGFGNDATLEDD